MPGLIATHEHTIFYMAVNSGLMFKNLYHDKDKMLADLKEYLEEHPQGPFLSFGGGFGHPVGTVIQASDILGASSDINRYGDVMASFSSYNFV